MTGAIEWTTGDDNSIVVRFDCELGAAINLAYSLRQHDDKQALIVTDEPYCLEGRTMFVIAL